VSPLDEWAARDISETHRADLEHRAAERYFDAAFEQFCKLANSAGATAVRRIEIAGRTVEIRISTGAMERAIMPGLSHLISADNVTPDLVLCAWDSESTGAPLLTPAWEIEDYRRDGLVSGYNDARFHTAAQFTPTILRILDLERRRALYWTPSAPSFPHWERGAPLRPLLHEWLRRIGMVAVHGGAIGRKDGGLLLAGAGGQGKSNIALACLNSELLYAADDFCVLAKSPDWTVHSLYCTGRILIEDLVRHPYLRGTESNPNPGPDEKLLFFLNERFGDKLIRQMPLRAIVLPRVVGEGQSRIVSTAPAAAQAALAMSTMMLSRWSSREMAAQMAELLRDLPCYELQIGACMEEVPRVLAELLSALAPNASGTR
jgi:hypothetical protein